jgi:hypothetical protein
VDPISEAVIRNSFVNCSKGEASRIKLPPDFRDTAWDDLDFLGWIDPAAPLRAALVVPDDDRPLGLVLRKSDARQGSAFRSSMCQVCFTDHAASGVSLFVAPLAGVAGRNGNSVGQYLCSDLACSLYLRGKRKAKLRLIRHEETLTLEQKIDRAMTKLFGFVERVTAH